jgi:hypothetical protein
LALEEINGNTKVSMIHLALFYIFMRNIMITQLGRISILLILKYSNKTLLTINQAECGLIKIWFW